MKRIRKCISMVLCFVMTVGLLSWMGPLKVRSANAAGGTVPFDENEFGKCYAKVLLTTVGNGYVSGGGYQLSGDVSKATPYNPVAIPSQSFDCCGLSITGLMAMGYTKFTDGTRDYLLNNQTGFNALRSVNGILYNHKSGDVVTLFGRA